MKKIIPCLVFFLIIVSCSEQEKEGRITYPKEKIQNTEKFNVKRFENYPDVVSMEDEKKLPSRKDTLPDGTIIEYSFRDNKEDGNKRYYTKTLIPPPPALFKKVKDFYPSGIIQKESDVFIGEMNIEPFYNNIMVKDYDRQGYLIKITDYADFDKKVKIKLKDLLEILQKEPMIREVSDANKESLFLGFFNKEITKDKITAERVISELKSNDCNGNILNPYSDAERKNIKISLDKDSWIVTKDNYPGGYWDYKIDASTGKVISVMYRLENRP
ncbi:MAG: hypothetical protein LBE92_05465 [Chryseobacterium sp.]|uniref:hypothetical protein n=1 Tax=Chryseobacterium sp. TaxID=1871047 RepID=UPI00282DE7B2|nr:hypothetical protein [Chryseobacterium sp.]MDR2235550.1 hypothetical protein [Chryseobacterium sp.]